MYKLIHENILDESSRFWANCPDSMTGDPDVCWEWKGLFFHPIPNYGNYLGFGAHRVAYFLHHEQQPGQRLVCHTCDNKRCVNPYHLFLGSHLDNKTDCVSKNRHAHGVRHGMSKVTDSDVLLIRASHEPIRDLMDRFGLSDTAVYYIRSRRTWKHVA
jgi:hypothetical protein